MLYGSITRLVGVAVCIPTTPRRQECVGQQLVAGGEVPEMIDVFFPRANLSHVRSSAN
jgi:hypothetical protein